MRIAIFGATGGTGRELVKQALEAGNEVIAYVRNPHKLNISHERLKGIQGELAEVNIARPLNIARTTPPRVFPWVVRGVRFKTRFKFSVFLPRAAR